MSSFKNSVEARELRILQSWNELEPYVESVQTASDSNKKSLGFLPASVFANHARRNQLFVAVDKISQKYLGHLLFDLKFPRATVLQMYSDPESRRRGVAGTLIAALKQLLSSHEFLSIKARVAEDLVDANE
ncbi:GNAT family N-acetyltransferase [Xanthomonas campestris]|uniref:GNAT family N-acetyltransferase n=1 Tax=Xanthomonas campestris pv. papavericola TaxID=487881 RepID=A0AAJ2X188_XANCA|nr:GNAT family N-acetyltransferase [Xanthomonas campestris]MEC3886929.1 GNAT family N-acetyltransferase [Xanthomonas campestris pv. papavericola]